MHSRSLKTLIQKLSALDLPRILSVGFLDHRVINELFLQEEVLVLLLSSPLYFLVGPGVKHSQLVELLFPFMLRVNRAEDIFSKFRPAHVSLLFSLNKL